MRSGVIAVGWFQSNRTGVGSTTVLYGSRSGTGKTDKPPHTGSNLFLLNVLVWLHVPDKLRPSGALGCLVESHRQAQVVTEA
jgi:hypothetical protein